MRALVYKVAALILLSSLSRGDLSEDDFRIINRRDLVATNSDFFEDEDSGSFSQLLFDVAREQVIVGAKDALYRLSLRGLKLIERASWPAPIDKVTLCQDKGQTEEDCHNFVKVLLAYGHKLLACGTNAFSPLCSWREIESLNTVSEWITGVAHCPYNPHSNVTALLSSSGDYYAGTPADFTGSDTAICRSRGAAVRDAGTLRTRQYDLDTLNEPQFTGSFEDDRFVYFVFREVAVEFMNCGTIIYSRIARVCKNDSGGHTMMKNSWSTFLKARLVCSTGGADGGEAPFHYDNVHSVEYLAQERLLVATFSTPGNSIAGSAVCIYNMSAIEAAFSGPYKVQQSSSSVWEPRVPSGHIRDHFNCQPSARSQQDMEYLRYHLMHDPIQPTSGGPVYKTELQRFTHLTVDVNPTKTGTQLVVFVATQHGDVLKLAVLPRINGACLVEVLRLRDDKGGYDVRAMQFVKETMSLYIGSDSAVVRLAGERCDRVKSRLGCGPDPHCQWDDSRDACIHGMDVADAVESCSSAVDSPVDGGWSSWSEWAPCTQEGTSQSAYGDRPDMCSCRSRRCDNPSPTRQGQPCKGASISVTNCTVHGGWSPWSGWSECSATCGIALKSRRRSCSAPEPKHGGRVCVGFDTEDVYCAKLPPCPDPDRAPIDGGWSPWSSWSHCSSGGGPGCGPSGGWRERRRACTNPPPKNGGVQCEGPKVDRQVCDMRPCEVRKATAWTPWVMTINNSSGGSYSEKRFKFLCKAPSSEQIRMLVSREEERYCNARGSCTSTPPEDEAGWDPWGPWGECSAPCGGGQQGRVRRCRKPPCVGSKDMLRACNTHACSGEWSCWSEWGPCVGSCARGGQRTRTRTCLSPEGCADAGAAQERRPCAMACAESESGWEPWGEWTTCESGERMRRRSCATNACVGAQVEVASPGENDSDKDLYAMPAYSPSVEMASFVNMDSDHLSIGGIVGVAVAAFLVGCLVCLAGVIFVNWRGVRLPWRRTTRVPSSPHYITAKQNSYVTVPLKEVPRKAKRQPSFTGIGGSSGILLSKSNNLSNANNHNIVATTPKLYPKAIANEYDSMGTLKRHSNQPNNRNNLDVEEDKFY